MVRVVSFLSFAVTIFLILNFDQIPNSHKLIFLLPFIFGLYAIFGSIHEYIPSYTSITLFYLLAFVKYVVLPFILASTYNYSAYKYLGNANQQHDLIAYGLIIYELFCIIIVLEISFKSLAKKEKDYVIAPDKFKSLSSSNTIYFIAIIIGFLGLVIYPHLIDNVIFFAPSSGYTKTDFNNTAISIIFKDFAIHIQTFLFLIIVKIYGKKLIFRKKTRQLPILVLIFSILNFVVIWNTNRTTLLINVIITIVILNYIFPSKKLAIKSYLITLGIIMVIYMTLFRSFGTTNVDKIDPTTVISIYGYNVVSLYLERYVSGPSAVAAGVRAKEMYNDQIGPNTLLNDLVLGTNFIQQIVKHFTNVFNDHTQRYYNVYSGFVDVDSLIIPSVIQGYMHFGFVGAPIFSILVLLIMIKAESKSKNTDDIGLKYSLVYLALFLAGIPGSNGILAISFISRQFIPLFLITYTNYIVKSQS